MSELSNYLRQHQGDKSVRAWGREAAARHDVGMSTVIPYFSGQHGRPQDKVLVALADVLHVPLKELRRLAGLWEGETNPYAPPKEADLMDDRQRKAVDELIRAFVNAPVSARDNGNVRHLWGDESVKPPKVGDLGVAADAEE